MLGDGAPEGAKINLIDNDLSLALIPVGNAMVDDNDTNRAGFDTGQGNEKKHMSEKDLSKRNSQATKTLDAGLPFQPCSDQ